MKIYPRFLACFPAVLFVAGCNSPSPSTSSRPFADASPNPAADGGSRVCDPLTPGDVAIDYVADVDDGQLIVVTRPKANYTNRDFRLFLGQPPALLEEHVEDFSRTGSGETLIQFFVVGKGQARAHFTLLEPAGDGGIVNHPGPGTLSGLGPDLSMTERFPTPTTLAGLSFTCL